MAVECRSRVQRVASSEVEVDLMHGGQVVSCVLRSGEMR